MRHLHYIHSIVHVSFIGTCMACVHCTCTIHHSCTDELSLDSTCVTMVQYSLIFGQQLLWRYVTSERNWCYILVNIELYSPVGRWDFVHVCGWISPWYKYLHSWYQYTIHVHVTYLYSPYQYGYMYTSLPRKSCYCCLSLSISCASYQQPHSNFNTPPFGHLPQVVMGREKPGHLEFEIQR